DPLFGVKESQPHAAPPHEFFQPLGKPPDAGTACVSSDVIRAEDAMPVGALEPIGIEALPDGSVLILDTPAGAGFSQVFHYRITDREGSPVALDSLDIGKDEPYRLRGQDLAFKDGILYIADAHGAQTFAFAYDPADPSWAAKPEPVFYPMLRFGG